MERLAGVVHADEGEKGSEQDDEDVPEHGVPGHAAPPDVQMEDAGPDKGEQAAREVAHEPHQDGEVGYEDGKEDGYHDDAYAEGEAPDLEVTVQAPDGGEHCLRLALEHLVLHELAGGVVGQRVGQQGLYHQDQVHDQLEPSVNVVDNDLLRVLLPGEEAEVAEQCLEDSRGYVAPVEHAVELALVHHVLL